MGLIQSPRVATDGLVFYYDQNNPKSYQGPAIQNLASTLAFNNSSGTGISIAGGYETVNVPQIGQANAVFSNIQNNYTAFSPNSGDCCPSPLYYGSGFAVSPSTLYTYAIVYKVDSGYTDANYMYRYEYVSNGGAYVGEAGVHNASNRIHLGDGWYWAWGTFTTASTTNWIGYHAAFYYRYSNKNDKFSVARVLIAQGNHTGLHPRYWPAVNTTRANTAAISDLSPGKKAATVANLTYAANGEFSFDGSTGSISITNTTLGNGNIPWTVSAWVRTTTNAATLGTGPILSNSSGGPVYSVMCVNSGKIAYWTYQSGDWAQKLGVGTTVNDGAWHMLTWVNYNNYTMDMYVDGVLDSNVPNSTSGNLNPVDMIGGSWASKFLGTIGNLSIYYDKALTPTEVAQNFNALRRRYGI